MATGRPSATEKGAESPAAAPGESLGVGMEPTAHAATRAAPLATLIQVTISPRQHGAPEIAPEIALAIPTNAKIFPKDGRLVYSHTISASDLGAGRPVHPMKGRVRVSVCGWPVAEFDYTDPILGSLLQKPAGEWPARAWTQLNARSEPFVVQLELARIPGREEPGAYSIERLAVHVSSTGSHLFSRALAGQPAPAEPETDFDKAISV